MNYFFPHNAISLRDCFGLDAPDRKYYAIALDATSAGSSTSTSPLTWSHTVTGSNTILFVSVLASATSPTISTPTYNGVSMTLIQAQITQSATGKAALYYLLNPATGTNTISVAFGGSVPTAIGAAVSWTGVNKYNQPDASNAASGSSAAPAVSLTTEAAGDWSIGLNIESATSSLSAGLTQRAAQSLTFPRSNLEDTNGPKTPAGVQSVNWTNAISASYSAIAAAFYMDGAAINIAVTDTTTPADTAANNKVRLSPRLTPTADTAAPGDKVAVYGSGGRLIKITDSTTPADTAANQKVRIRLNIDPPDALDSTSPSDVVGNIGQPNTNAIAFDGSTDFGTVNNYAALSALSGGATTLEGWFYQHSASTDYRVAASLADSGGADHAIGLQRDNSGQQAANAANFWTSQSADLYTTGSQPFATDTWVYVAIVYDPNGDNKTHVYYGPSATETSYGLQHTGTGSRVSSSGYNLYLGQDPADAGSGKWLGNIGGFVRVWNVARTTTQLSDNYNHTLQSANETGLIANFNFTEGSGTQIANESNASYPMNFGGSPSWVTGPTTTAQTYSSNPTITITDSTAPSDADTNTGDVQLEDYITVVDSSTPSDADTNTGDVQLEDYITVTDSTTPSDADTGTGDVVLTSAPVSFSVSVVDSTTPSDADTSTGDVVIPKNYISVFDSTTPSDADTSTGDVVIPKLYISVLDSTTPSDADTSTGDVQIPKNYISVSDTTTPSDTLGEYIPSNYISITENTTPTDAVTLQIPKNYISVNDTSAPADSIIVQIPQLYVSVSDTSTPSDTLGEYIPANYISVSDTTTPTDTENEVIGNNISLSDATTPSDTLGEYIPQNYITILESTTPTDNIIIYIPNNYISVLDSTAPSDTLGEYIPANYISISDTTTPTDSITVQIPKNYISVTDSTTPSDALGEYIPANYVNVSDTTTPTDVVGQILVQNYISVSDTTTPADNLGESIPSNYITVTDSTIPSDVIGISIVGSAPTPNISDGTTATDSVTIQIPKNYIAITDTTTPADTIIVSIPKLYVSLLDASAPTDAMGQVLTKNYINVNDSTAVSDNLGEQIPVNYISVTDSTTPTDSVNAPTSLNINTNDVVVIADQRTNWITNPSFETTDAWIRTGGDYLIHNTTDQHLYGSYSGYVTTGAVWGQWGEYMRYIVDGVIPGHTYTYSVYAYVASTTPYNSQIEIMTNDWGNRGNAIGSVKDSWERLTVTYTVPAGFTQLFITLESTGWQPSVGTIYWDGVLFEESPTVGSYFDGTTTGASWTGTANASTSITALGVVKTQIPANYISVTDTTIPSDNLGESIPANYISVIDVTTPADSINLYSGTGGIHITEATTPTDIVAVTIPKNYILVSDTSTPTDSVALFVQNYISVTDTTTPADNLGEYMPINYISVGDQTTVADQRTNLLKNPSFEIADWNTYWTIGNDVGNGSIEQALYGSKSHKVIWAAQDLYTSQVVNNLVVGSTYTFSLYAYISSYTSGSVAVCYSNVDFTNFNFINFNMGTVGSWQRQSITFVADATSKQIRYGSYGPVTATVYFDGALLESTPTAGSYFDGSFTGASWTGTADQTSSITALGVVNVITKNYISVSDGTTPSDNLGEYIPKNYISVMDTSTPTDSVTVSIPKNYINVTDASAPSDTLKGQLPGNSISVVDATAPGDQRTNLVPNPSFETDTSNWTLAFEASWSAEQAYVGTHSLKFYCTVGKNKASTTGYIPVLPNTQYTVSGYLYKTAGSTGSLSIDTLEFDSGYSMVSDNGGQLQSNFDHWDRSSWTTTTQPNTAYIQVRMVNDTNFIGTAYGDAFQLEATPSATAYIDTSVSAAGVVTAQIPKNYITVTDATSSDDSVMLSLYMATLNILISNPWVGGVQLT